MELKGKKVLVVGLGKSGLAAALFLRRQGAQVTVSDVRSAEALAKEIPCAAGRRNRGRSRRAWTADVPPPGSDRRQPRACRWIHRSWCRCRTLACRSSANWNWHHAISREDAGDYRLERKDHHHHTVRRDIEGRADCRRRLAATSACLLSRSVDQSRADGWSVLEVSSFQLESTESFIPEIAVILNITPDHLDRHGTFENYVAAKERIFRHQTGETLWC